MANAIAGRLEGAPEYDVTGQTVPNAGQDRIFLQLRRRGENVLDSNLTELAAAQAVERGFMEHNDWMAHAMRYSFCMKYLVPWMRVLDVGCGQMQLPFYAYRNRFPPVAEYWGIDLRATPAWLRDVGWKCPITLVKADFAVDAERIEQLSGFGAFDAVVYMEAHEHVGTRDFQREAMFNIYEWLAPGGLLFFSTPNAGVSDTTAANHLSLDGESREWTYPEKLALLREVGFELLDAFGTFGAVRRLPEEAFEQPSVKAARRYLSTTMFTNFAYAAYPDLANNAIMLCKKPSTES